TPSTSRAPLRRGCDDARAEPPRTPYPHPLHGGRAPSPYPRPAVDAGPPAAVRRVLGQRRRGAGAGRPPGRVRPAQPLVPGPAVRRGGRRVPPVAAARDAGRTGGSPATGLVGPLRPDRRGRRPLPPPATSPRGRP